MESTIKYYGLKDVLSFGKYRGQQVCGVIDLDINYITWCWDNIPTFKLSKDALNKCVKLLKDEKAVSKHFDS